MRVIAKFQPSWTAFLLFPQQQMIKASMNAEAASKSVSSGGGPVVASPHQAGARPRDVNAFGFGNVRTGQVHHTSV